MASSRSARVTRSPSAGSPAHIPAMPTYGSTAQRLGQLVDSRQRPDEAGRRQLVRRARDGVAPAREHARGVLDRVGDVDREHLRPERVQPQLEGRHDPEVAAAAAQRPVEVRVLGGARADRPAVGEDDLGGDEVVDGHAVAPALVGDTAAERQPGHAGLGDDPARSGEAQRRGDPVDVGPRRAALHVHGAAGGVDAHAAHRGQVDHEPVVDDGGAGDVVPAAADGERQSVLGGEAHGGRDVVRVAQRTIATGRLSIIPFHTRRAESYAGWSGVMTSPGRSERVWGGGGDGHGRKTAPRPSRHRPADRPASVAVRSPLKNSGAPAAVGRAVRSLSPGRVHPREPRAVDGRRREPARARRADQPPGPSDDRAARDLAWGRQQRQALREAGVARPPVPAAAVPRSARLVLSWPGSRDTDSYGRGIDTPVRARLAVIGFCEQRDRSRGRGLRMFPRGERGNPRRQRANSTARV